MIKRTLKVGDKVRVKKFKKFSSKALEARGIISTMQNYIGKIVTIHSVHKYHTYMIEDDKYLWLHEWFKEVKTGRFINDLSRFTSEQIERFRESAKKQLEIGGECYEIDCSECRGCHEYNNNVPCVYNGWKNDKIAAVNKAEQTIESCKEFLEATKDFEKEGEI